MSIRRNFRIETCKSRLTHILGCFGFAQLPSDGVSAVRVTTCERYRLTPWVVAALPSRHQTEFTDRNMKKVVWHPDFFGFAHWPSDGVYASQHVNTRLTSGFARLPSDGVSASQHVNAIGWHPGLLRLCPVAIKRSLCVKPCKRYRLTACVFRLCPAAFRLWRNMHIRQCVCAFHTCL